MNASNPELDKIHKDLEEVLKELGVAPLPELKAETSTAMVLLGQLIHRFRGAGEIRLAREVLQWEDQFDHAFEISIFGISASSHRQYTLDSAIIVALMETLRKCVFVMSITLEEWEILSREMPAITSIVPKSEERPAYLLINRGARYWVPQKEWFPPSIISGEHPPQPLYRLEVFEQIAKDLGLPPNKLVEKMKAIRVP